MAKKAAAKPKTVKKPKASKPKAPAKKAAAANPKKFNTVDPAQKQSFLEALPRVKEARSLATKYTGKLRNLYGEMKKVGFTKRDFDDAIAMETPEAEKAKKASITRTLLIAQIMGADMGAKHDLFAEDERILAVDRAYEEGQRASMENRAAVPGYDPSTEQYRAYMKGFHAHQETILAKNLKKKVDPAEPPNATAPAQTDIEDKIAEQSAIDMPPPPGSPAARKAAEDAVGSGVPVSRSEFMKRQADQATKPN